MAATVDPRHLMSEARVQDCMEKIRELEQRLRFSEWQQQQQQQQSHLRSEPSAGLTDLRALQQLLGDLGGPRSALAHDKPWDATVASVMVGILVLALVVAVVVMAVQLRSARGATVA
jgi:hypothetical protein